MVSGGDPGAGAPHAVADASVMAASAAHRSLGRVTPSMVQESGVHALFRTPGLLLPYGMSSQGFSVAFKNLGRGLF
jgi:hypothetical protein